MNIEIRKLTPQLAEEYVHFFDVTPHDDTVEEHKCYCVTWRSDDSSATDHTHWYPTREERREHAIQLVREGRIQGYLAYQDNEIVGWCNANADCQECIDYLRAYWPIAEYPDGIRVKSIFCFVIAPRLQRKGIATKLLERVCKDAASDGFDFVEAYVNQEFIDTAHEFRGPLAMYEKCGFQKYAEREGKIVMRRALNGSSSVKRLLNL